MSEKNETMDLVFIIDRSGSMHGLEDDTIGGFSQVLEDDRKQGLDCRVTTILFDSRSQVLQDRVPIAEAQPLTHETYRPGGMTALLDALGGAMDHLVWGKDTPDHAQFVIITDGMENSSREYTLPKVRAMVEKLKAERGWDFIFLGANIDAIATAERMGISPDRAVDAVSDSEGVRAQFVAVGEANLDFMRAPRAARSAGWKGAVEKDRERRGR